MECDKIQERFSSLMENDLSPADEKEVRDHLSSCSGCQKEFKQFEKTMQWLHSVKEVEVPEGFLSGIQERMDQQKEVTAGEKTKWRWLSYPPSLKLPIQAAAMVTVVFLAFYLTKMMPGDKSSLLNLKDIEQAKVPPSEVTRAEKPSLPTQTEEDKKIARLSPEARLRKDAEPGQAMGSAETTLEGKFVPGPREEAKGTAALPPKTETAGEIEYRQKGRGEAIAPPMRTETGGRTLIPKEEGRLPAKPSQEIVLKISDRNKTLLQIHELVKQFEGEVVKTEGNILHAFLPVGSFPEFKKELTGLSFQTKADQVVAREELPEALSKAPEAKKKKVKEKEREFQAPLPEKEDRISVRILILQN